MIFTYCEGDTTLKEAASHEEFAAELREIDAWNRARGYGPARIDPGFDPAMKAVFEVLGLAGMLH
jgi:hypothetical protein